MQTPINDSKRQEVDAKVGRLRRLGVYLRTYMDMRLTLSLQTINRVDKPDTFGPSNWMIFNLWLCLSALDKQQRTLAICTALTDVAIFRPAIRLLSPHARRVSCLLSRLA